MKSNKTWLQKLAWIFTAPKTLTTTLEELQKANQEILILRQIIKRVICMNKDIVYAAMTEQENITINKELDYMIRLEICGNEIICHECKKARDVSWFPKMIRHNKHKKICIDCFETHNPNWVYTNVSKDDIKLVFKYLFNKNIELIYP